MNLGKLPAEQELLEIALRRARKQASQIGKQQNRVKQEKAMEIRRIEVAANYIIRALDRAVKEFPSIEQISPFYRELMQEIIDIDSTRKALGQFSSVAAIARKLKSEHIVRVKKLGRHSEGKAREASKAFLGRVSSAVRSLGKNIDVYNTAAEKLREMPNIRTDMPSIIIAGYPNVGKSTLLGKITESKPKVASYPFTTQRLELGYFKEHYMEFQVIDTPGLLDRPLEERNQIEKKGIAALKYLASLIVFVIDPTEQCGFSLEKQFGLLNGIAQEFGKPKVFVYLSKTDVATKQELQVAKAKLTGFSLLEGNSQELKAEITKDALATAPKRALKFPLN